MGVLSWIVFGLIAGIIAKFLMPGRDPGGCIITMLLGVAGAFVGGFIYKLVTGTELLYFGFDLRSFAVAVLGAVAVLAVYRLILRS
ncbi:MAG TPA: GlsB/YeaQ/YmgE family stress response membrane protein [Rubrobacter sp.]|nr:GlsB/YeaQ/YmgE family stress response membrane protein [Rubrobacter sp.]